MRTSIIVAAGENDVISRNDHIPWDLPEDRQRFRALTVGHVVIVGRHTHEQIINSLGHVLPNRLTIVLSHTVPSGNMMIHGGRDIVIYQPSMRSAMLTARALERFAGHAEVYVIGGGEVYAAALPYVDHVYLTRVHTDTPGDVRMPEGWLSSFNRDYSLHQTIHPEGEPDYNFEMYERRIDVDH